MMIVLFLISFKVFLHIRLNYLECIWPSTILFTFKKIEIELNQKLHKKETKWDTKQIN